MEHGAWQIRVRRAARSGLRTPRKEEQVEVRSKGMSRAIGGQKGRGENEAERRESRTNSAHGLWISRSLDEGRGGVLRSKRARRMAACKGGQRARRAG